MAKRKPTPNIEPGRVLVLFLFWMWPLAGQAAGPDSSEVVDVCLGCHGERGVSSNPMVPTLAGQPYTLIEDNLLAFRAGRRSCAPQRDDGSASAVLTKTMCAAVSDLTDAEIAELANYFESRKFEPVKQTFDPALAAVGAELHREEGCERCHSDGGRTTNLMAPVLAGQWMPYLRQAMSAIRSGEKSGPKMMNKAVKGLSPNEVEALLHYYASAGQRLGEATLP